MKALLVGRLKKWMFFAVIGCIAYFAGFFWGHRNYVPQREPTSITIGHPKK